jgi:hypothetical protein
MAGGNPRSESANLACLPGITQENREMGVHIPFRRSVVGLAVHHLQHGVVEIAVAVEASAGRRST